MCGSNFVHGLYLSLGTSQEGSPTCSTVEQDKLFLYYASAGVFEGLVCVYDDQCSNLQLQCVSGADQEGIEWGNDPRLCMQLHSLRLQESRSEEASSLGHRHRHCTAVIRYARQDAAQLCDTTVDIASRDDSVFKRQNSSTGTVYSGRDQNEPGMAPEKGGYSQACKLKKSTKCQGQAEPN